MIDFRILLFDNFETLDVMGPAEVIGRLPDRYRLRCVSLNGGIVTSTQGVRVDTEPLAGLASVAAKAVAPANTAVTGSGATGVSAKVTGDASGQTASGAGTSAQTTSTAPSSVEGASGIVDHSDAWEPPARVFAKTPPVVSGERSGRYVLLVPGGLGTRELVNDTAFIDRLTALTEGAWRVLTVCTGSALLAKTGLLDGLAATTNKKAFEWVASLRPQVGWQRSARWVKAGHIYTSSGVSAGMDLALGFIADHDGPELAHEIANRIEYIWNPDSNNDLFAVQG